MDREDLIRRSGAIKAFCMDCKGQGEPCEHSDTCKTMKVLRSRKKIPAVEPKTKVIAQVTFDEDKLREIVHEAVERIKEEYDIVDNPGAVSKWIPCSERLPEHTHPWGIYLITFGASNIVAMAYYRYGRWELQGNDLDVTDAVKAWMPLPKPWKGADDEKRL